MRTVPLMIMSACFALALTACQDPQPAQRRQAPAPTRAPDPVAAPAGMGGQGLGAAEQAHGVSAQPTAGAPRAGEVLETMDAASYTYARLKTAEGGEVWVAGPQTAVAVGDRVEVSAGMLMRGFESKALGRRFDEVWFVDRLAVAGTGGAAAPPPSDPHADPHGDPHAPLSAQGPSGPAQVAPLAIQPLAPLEGGVTIGQLLDQPAAWEGKEVSLRATVVRVNAEIMGRDWLHLQDGTRAAAGAFDLTATSPEGGAPTGAQPGDVVRVKGVLALDRDFGSGYRYGVLLEKVVLELERR